MVILCSLRVSVEKHVPTPDGSEGVVNRSKLTALGTLSELNFEMVCGEASLHMKYFGGRG